MISYLVSSENFFSKGGFDVIVSNSFRVFSCCSVSLHQSHGKNHIALDILQNSDLRLWSCIFLNTQLNIAPSMAAFTLSSSALLCAFTAIAFKKGKALCGLIFLICLNHSCSACLKLILHIFLYFSSNHPKYSSVFSFNFSAKVLDHLLA